MEINTEDLINTEDNLTNMIRYKQQIMSQFQENNCKIEKNSYLLMKQKLWKTHDLIKQYSEKVKENASLKSDFEVTKKEVMHITSNYKSAMAKITELKHTLMDTEEKNKKLKSKEDKYETNIAAIKKKVQQLECRIKEMDEEHASKIMEYDLQKSGLEEKIKDLEYDLKKSKLVLKKKEQRINSINFDKTKLVDTTTKSTRDIGINVSLCDSELNTKPKVQDISIMTDEFYNIKDNPYPLFCSKCETHLSPTVTPEKICRVMNTLPKLIDRNLSPQKKILPSYLSCDTYADCTNKDEDINFFELSTSCPRSYNDSVVAHLRPELSHLFGKTQCSENELKGSNAYTMHVPIATNISTNPCYGSAKLNILPENVEYKKKHSYSTGNFLAQHVSSFKKIQRKLKLLGKKMKKLQKSQKKQRSSSCHCVTNSASINSDLLSSMFKCVAQCYDERRDNERKIESEKYRKNTAEKIQVKKRKRLNAYNVSSKDLFWSRYKNLDDTSTEEDTSSQEEDTLSQEEDTLSQEEDTLSQEEDISSQEENTPMQKENACMQKGKSSMQKKGTSIQEDTTMQEEDICEQEMSTPMQEECIFVQKESTSMQKEGIFMQERDISIQKEGTSMQEEDIPTQEENIPMQEKDISLQEEDTFKQEENTSMQEERISMEEESTSMQKEGISMQEGDIPVQEEGTFMQEENILIQEDLPIEGEDILIQEEDIPLQEDDLPIQDDLSVQEEDTPTQDTIEKDSIQDTICNKSEEVATKTDILHQSSHTSCINKSTSTLNVNAYNVFFNGADQFSEEALATNRKLLYIAAEKASLEASEKKSRLSNDEICTSNNLFSESNVESVMEKTCLSPSDDNKNCNKRSINRAILDRKIHIIAERNNVKGKIQNKEKLNSRLLKKLRTLKRKTQNGSINKQENIVSRPNYNSEPNKLVKRKPQVENKNETDNRTKQIRTLKRNLETRTISSCTNMQENGTKESDTESYSEPPKKRIAHVPKALPVPQLSVNQQVFTHYTIKNMVNLEAFRQKRDRIQRLGALTRKNSLLIKSGEANAINKNNEKNFVECTKAGSIDQKSTSEKYQDNFPLPVRTISSFNKGDDVSIKGTDKNVSIERDMTRALIKYEEAEIVEPKKVITPVVGLHSCNTMEDKRSDDRETLKNMKNELTSNQLVALKAMLYKSHDCNKTSKIQHLPLRNSAIIAEDCVDDNNTEESLNKVRSTIGTRENASINDEIPGIQTIETRIEDINKTDEKIESTSVCREDVNDVENFQTPIFPLMEHIKKRIVPKRPNKNITYICKLADKFVKMQLIKLRDSPWENSTHCDIIQKLNNTCGPRIIAKCIVEFLLENVDYEKSLDKSFTPPAPLMTAFEQKIIALLVDLETWKPKTIYFVQAAIEYKLFRLTNEVKVTQVETLTRIYVALARIQKDREKVRMMCCNALYFLGFKSIHVVYTILTSWPEVLPNAKTNKGILPKCIAFLIDSQYAIEMNKLNALKSLISAFYEYSFTTTTAEDIAAELMNALKAKKTDGLETAFILVAKRKKPSWAYINIIKSNLLPMIINQELPCVYSAFSLLGKLMRPFPLEDKDRIVKDISEQLRDLIQSGQGSDDQQEGIISALLSLSRHEFDTVAQCVVKWRPNKSLRSATVAQLEGFIKTRNATFWKRYLQNKKKKKKSVQNKK